MSTVAIVAIMARRKKLIRLFRNAGATAYHSSINIQQYGIRQSLPFKKLVREGLFVNAGDEKFYLDEEKEREAAMQRQKIILIILCIAILLMVVGLFGVYKSVT